MSKEKREVGKAIRKLKRAKDSGESLKISRKLKAEKPEVYRKMMEQSGE